MGKTGIDAAWETLFERHHILERIQADGLFRITSGEINQVKEARLMAKFDRSAQLPLIFRRSRLKGVVIKGVELMGDGVNNIIHPKHGFFF